MNFIKSIIARLRPATTTASLMAGFTDTINKLEEHSVAASTSAAAQRDAINVARAKAFETEQDARAASDAAIRLRGLVG